MAEAIREIKEIIKHIESELYNVKNKLTTLELSDENTKHKKAAEEWLSLVRKSSGKWSPKSHSSVQITRLGRRHAKS